MWIYYKTSKTLIFMLSQVFEYVYDMIFNRSSSFYRSLIYTVGHVLIATVCNVFITGAVIKLAFTDALVEPLCNWVWYYALDVMWNKRCNKSG